MAEQIISPGVFTRENDLSFLPQGIGAIGAAIIGPTVKGPAFVPTVVRSFAEYERRFGPLSSETYVPQTVREYLKNAGSVTVCRVLAGGGWTLTSTAGGTGAVAIVASASADNADGNNDNVLLGMIYPSKHTGAPGLNETTFTGPSNQVDSGSISSNFSITLSGSTGTKQLSASVNPANSNYLFKQLGNNPNNSRNGDNTFGGTPGYTYVNWKSLQTSILATTADTESIVVLFPSTSAHLGINTASLQNDTLGSSGSFYLTDNDGTAHTLFFTGSTSVLPPTDGSFSGSLVAMNLSSVGGESASGQQLTTLFSDAVNTLDEFSSSISTDGLSASVFTVEIGNVADLTTTFGSGTASVGTATDGSQMSPPNGYPLYASSDVMLIRQSANITYSGLSGVEEKYSHASTPWITSQFLDANKSTTQLFKFHTINHGTTCNTDYKVSIANLKEPADVDGVEQYSQFSVIVRKYSDKDKSPVVLEQYNNCTLDPNSPNYISRKIGDRYPLYNDTLDKVELLGNYPNISDYIRVEVYSSVAERAVSPKLSPKGFSAISDPIPTSSFGTNFHVPSASYEGVQQTGTDSTYDTRGYLGWKFTDKYADNANWIKPLPDDVGSNVSGDFNVENYSGHPSSSLWLGSLSASVKTNPDNGPVASQLKFTVPFQGGDDGISPSTVKQVGKNITDENVYGLNLKATSNTGYKGYKKAIDILSNQDEYDINMLALPGVIKSLHPLVTQAGIDMAEQRGDCFYVMDLDIQEASVNTAVSTVGGLDSSYAAVYYPWVKVLDSSINKPVLVPPSVIVPGAIAASDRIGAEWFAPAGLNRGILGNVLEAKIRLTQAERDTLYDAKINPIATFPQTGVCIWGQKTLQERSTALDRINVRRLMIALKKFIASSSKYLVFEQNTIQTRTRFLNIVNPYLESVQQRQGLYAFRVQMDESNNTPTVIDRNQLVGAIYLQPTKTAEFIILDFNVMPTGATFDTGGGAGY
jgi:hypothetical protein